MAEVVNTRAPRADQQQKVNTLIDDAVARALSNGQRNVSGFKLACDCRNLRLTFDETLALSEEWVRRVNEAVPDDHPYTTKEFGYSVSSAFRREAQARKRRGQSK